MPGNVRSIFSITACCFLPSASSFAFALAFFFLLTARLQKADSSSSRTIRSGVAWKFSLSGRSTVILRKPKRVVGNILTYSQHPNVRGNACVVKELLRQSDQCFKPVVFQNP